MTVEDFLKLNEKYIGPTGGSWDDCNAIAQLNKARSALYGIDSWSGLVDTVCVPSCGPIHIPWFADRAVGAYRCTGIIQIATGEYWVGADNSCCGAPEHITDLNTISPVPITNSFKSRLGIKLTDLMDEGTVVRITYQNESGSYITEDLVGKYDEFSVTESRVRKVISIKKNPTSGFIQFFSVNSDGSCCDLLFSAHPMEGHLQYKQYCVSNECCNACKQIILKVKRKYIGLSNMHYNLPIEFPEHALSLAMQAEAERDKRTPESFTAYQAMIGSAIAYMRKNEIKEKDTYGNLTQSNDYPEVVN
jgi:hypothetical protein